MSVSLVLVEVTSSSSDLYCLVDTFTYNCSIQSTAGEAVNISWRIIFPDERMAITISEDVATMGVRTQFTRNINGTVESTLTLTLQNLRQNGTTVECIGPNSVKNNATVYYRLSGMNYS